MKGTKQLLKFDSKRVQTVYNALKPYYVQTHFKNTLPFSQSLLATALGLERTTLHHAESHNTIPLSVVLHMELLLEKLTRTQPLHD